MKVCKVESCPRPYHAGGFCEMHYRRWERRDESVVYFVECGDFIKVGFTQYLTARLAAMETQNPYDVKLLATIKGDLEKEKEIQDQFAQSRHRGEWFRKTPELLFYIDRVKNDRR